MKGEELHLETRFYLFRLHLRKVEKAAERLTRKGGKFSFELSWREDKGVSTSYRTPDEKTSTEFAVLMSRFLLPEDKLHVDNILAMMELLSDSPIMMDFIAEIRRAFEDAAKGTIKLVRNGQRLGARSIFEEMARNVLFCDDTVRDEYLGQLQTDPVIANLYWNTFYEYCLQAFEILKNANHFVEEHGFFPPHVVSDDRCIYCGTSEGSFTTVEHIVPEALGNEDIILPRGYVCDKCNNETSSLEQVFLDSPPLDLLRIFCVDYNKKGAFPYYRSPEIHMERTSPNSVRITSYAGVKSLPQIITRSDGACEVNIETREENKFDHITFARVLFKIGLGAIALREGREAALHPRFSQAREFICKGGTFPNQLIISRSAEPRAGFAVQWVYRSPAGTTLACDLLGAQFIVGLEPSHLVPLSDQMLALAVAYDLWNASRGPHHKESKGRGPA